MKVSELIRKLKKVPQDLEVYAVIHDQRPYHVDDIGIWIHDGSSGYPKMKDDNLAIDEEEILVIDATS